MTERIKISKLKPNPSNPRIIKDDKFAKLVQSIKDFPEMLNLRPIVCNADMIVLGGNMRLKAAKEAGLKEVPVIISKDLTPEQEKEFIIKDNVSGGEWDWDILKEDWDAELLDSWGLDLPSFEEVENDKDYSDKNKEINTGDFSDKMTIKLEYTEEDYHRVKEAFHNIGGTPEQIIWNLLQLDETVI